MKKLELNKIVEKLKEGAKQQKKEKVPFNPAIKPEQLGPRVRDMRQDAMDLGSHGAKEYFGEPIDAGTI